MDQQTIYQAKQTVLAYQQDFAAAKDDFAAVLNSYCAGNYAWRGCHPFNELQGAEVVSTTVWQPLQRSLRGLQRRQDIFFAGANNAYQDEAIWVASMGHFMGLFDEDWLGIPATGKLALLRYAEFHQVVGQGIVQSALFCDIIGLMQQAGCYPLPPPTGAVGIHPGPLSNDGIQLDMAPPKDGAATLSLLNRMIDDLDQLNRSGNDQCPPELLAQTWHDNMAWYGPAGIGSTYTIERYQQQHQYPFRQQLKDKVFNGHVARIAEGNYAGFFGWPNLTNTASGGFLGLPGNEIRADMRVVDIYRRQGDKLAENWVFIDLLHYLRMQGLDVLDRLDSQR